MLGYDKLGYDEQRHDEIDGGLLEYMRMGDIQELRNEVLGQDELQVGED